MEVANIPPEAQIVADYQIQAQRILDDLCRRAQHSPMPVVGAWGEASTPDNTIRLSSSLFEQPIETIQSVMAHELGHLHHRHRANAKRWAYAAVGAVLATLVAVWIYTGNPWLAPITLVVAIAFRLLYVRLRDVIVYSWQASGLDPKQREAEVFAERLVVLIFGRDMSPTYATHGSTMTIDNPDHWSEVSN